MMHYTLMAFAPDAREPDATRVTADHDAAALEMVRALLRKPSGLRQVELWRDERRIATVERVV